MDLDAIRKKEQRFAIGLTAGSSCEGVDAAIVRLKGSGTDLHMKLGKAKHFPFTPGFRTRLLGRKMDVQEACLLNSEIGERLAEAAIEMMNMAREEDLPDIDFIASGGHTVAHIPLRASSLAGGSMQLGEPAIIAERTGLPVVSDFRSRDIAAGGQGAPVEAYADWVLFAQKKRTVACLNIGGIASITTVTPDFDHVTAFDIGPGNMAIDGAVQILTKGIQQIDTDGQAAAKGVVIDEYLDFLLEHPFFNRVPPKSTGWEEFGPEVYLRDSLVARDGNTFDDIIATVTSAVAYSIARAFNRFVTPHYDVERLIISGGGTRNKALVDRIQRAIPDVVVRTSDTYRIPPRMRDPIAYAILGNETVCDTPANIPQATGARRAVVLGKITPN